MTGPVGVRINVATAKSICSKFNKETEPAMSDVDTPSTETQATAVQAVAPSAPKSAPATAKSVKTTAKASLAKPTKPAKAKTVKAKKAAPKKSTVTAKSAPSKPAPKAAKPAPKAKLAARNAKSFAMNDTIESMTAASNEALKEGFEKTLKSVTEASNFQKETVDAMIASATLAGKGFETANANAVTYAKSAMEDSVTATKKFASAKSVQEMFEIQSEFTKTAMENYLAEVNKTSELFSDLFKNSVKPINDRVSAAMEFAQTQR
ncbi:TIGR01841 family phasin [uncultured Maricaulis sp.]|uniref:phasin family protein n=1 Tax=uncultured Maricaulis sp. TaxID=174710 RepID=UPI0030DB1CE3